MKSYKVRRMEKVRKNILQNIEKVEKKRKRSEYAITDAAFTGKECSDEDMQYFTQYEEEIKLLRDQLRNLEVAISSLEERMKNRIIE